MSPSPMPCRPNGLPTFTDLAAVQVAAAADATAKANAAEANAEAASDPVGTAAGLVGAHEAGVCVHSRRATVGADAYLTISASGLLDPDLPGPFDLDTTAGDVTITLPYSTSLDGDQLFRRDFRWVAGAHVAKIACSASGPPMDLLDGAASFTIPALWMDVTIEMDEDNKWAIR